MVCELQNGSGWYDITPYIKFGGWKDSRNDVDGSNAGRNIEGTMIRDRVATKYRVDITCTPITKQILDTIKNLIYPVSFQMRFRDDSSSDWTYRTVYSNNFSWTYLLKKGNVEYYDGFTFPLIEV